MQTFYIIIQLLFVPVVSPALIGFIRKTKARLQNREGAAIFQPYRDLWKLFHKDEVVSHDVSWIFLFMPYLLFTISLVIGLLIPIFTSTPTFIAGSDFLIIVYLLMLGTFFMALAGVDVGSGFGGFGSSREMTVAALTEGGLIFSLLVLSFAAKTTDLFGITDGVRNLPYSALVPVGLVFISFSISILAETARFPFDNPATHLELTMIHEAMILEYSGKRLALIEWAAANKLLIFLLLGANLFFPWGIPALSGLSPALLFVSLFWCLIKVSCFGLLIAILESSIAKLRFFRIPDLLLTSLVISIIALGLII